MRRVILCSRLMLLACLTTGTFEAPIVDSNSTDKDAQLHLQLPNLDHTIIELLKDVLKEQNKNSKPPEASWMEMLSRSLPWIPWVMMGMGRGCSQCPCTSCPYATLAPPAMPPFMGIPYYDGYNPQYRLPELYPTNIALPQSHNQLSDSNVLPQSFLDSTQAQTIPHSTRSPYNYFSHQSLPIAATSYYPDQPFVTGEDLVQQQGIIQAIKSRLKTELAGVATKINPVDQPSQSVAVQQPKFSTTQGSLISQQRSSAPLFSSDHLQHPKVGRPVSTGQQTSSAQRSRSSKPSFWKQVTSSL